MSYVCTAAAISIIIPDTILPASWWVEFLTQTPFISRTLSP